MLDEQDLFIPERPGNRRMDSVQNILTNPHIGIQFFIPGFGETLRVNGKAFVSRDPELLEQCVANGRSPLFGIGVEVEECYTHCARAFIRSGLWTPESWFPKEQLPTFPRMLIDHARFLNVMEEQLAIDLNEGYKSQLY
ncbi:pyridoxamine 5'-phosphate oxidase-related FMN-binding protein [Paenibacillus curdlanolyticus YK9]|uniref:Pyridoxamine 5'-phosphate oxidase-related FMN-binding protein n=1 Tax=Paenibacillus curdlanolyticus YK9 TaxID=717606 RepID=E0I502_9BACL|nr:pyridoxamine 5'-phosphate oxidase family protein [Paenibacillus curdlanolyticus]EFM12044.1 pyridoxamine 5'-phosphate oxidase-related FMN-binding protein [Paenibacillus curdlanolyticus YK9]